MSTKTRFILYGVGFALALGFAFIPVPVTANTLIFLLFLGAALLEVFVALWLTFALKPLRDWFFFAKVAIVITMLGICRYTALLRNGTFIVDVIWIALAGAVLIDFRRGKEDFVAIGLTIAAVVAMFFPGLRFIGYAIMAINAVSYTFFHKELYEELFCFFVGAYSLGFMIGFIPFFEGMRFGLFIPFLALGFGCLYPQIRKMAQIKKENDVISENELRLARIEERALKEEIRPHFLLNALNNVRVAYHDDLEDGKTLLGELIHLESMIDEASRSELIPIKEEVSIIAGLIRLFSLERKTGVGFDVELEDEEVLIPPMLLEPLVENSLQHSGVMGQENGTITIRQTSDFGFAIISVADNGQGLPLPSQSRGIGLSNVMTRVGLLDEGHMDIFSDDNGTVIEIRFRLPKE
ncbi:MAG: histidine kinase [Bacilli bacterium]|nr:histidine kinase [Bacilli bacterium]